jgi:predicted nucleic acid-binding protein
MTAADLFVDTNILVYAHDQDAGAKRERAMARLEGCWTAPRMPWISAQVLNEFYARLTRGGAPARPVRALVESYSKWRVVPLTTGTTRQAFAEMDRWRLSFWDALILAAAREVGARTIWSEDFNAGQDYGGVRVVNPLVEGRGS